MKVEHITRRADLVIRRLVLEPGEAMPWHTDICRRFTVVVRGSRLAIEYRDSGEHIDIAVAPGHTGWDDPEPRVHRAVNEGAEPYEEVVTFFPDGAVFQDGAAADPQPPADIGRM